MYKQRFAGVDLGRLKGGVLVLGCPGGPAESAPDRVRSRWLGGFAEEGSEEANWNSLIFAFVRLRLTRRRLPPNSAVQRGRVGEGGERAELPKSIKEKSVVCLWI